MTTLCLWRGDGCDIEQLWACADSQISERSSAILVDVPKIFSLSVAVRNVNSSTIHLHMIGMAYTGSTLLANAVFGNLSNVVGNLFSHEDRVVEIREVGTIAAKILEVVAGQYSTLAEKESPVEIVIFGVCPVTQKSSVFRLRPRWEMILGIRGRCNVNVVEVDASSPDFLLVLGDQIEGMKLEIEAARLQRANCLSDWVSAPIAAIKHVIRADTGLASGERRFQTIGGAVQYGVARRTGFVLYLNVGENEGAILSILGIDIEKLGIPSGVTLGKVGMNFKRFAPESR